MQSLKDLDGTIDDLLQWLSSVEARLKDLEMEELPDDVNSIETLIDEHKVFMENTAKRQSEIDFICKPTRPKPALKEIRKASTRGMIRTPRYD